MHKMLLCLLWLVSYWLPVNCLCPFPGITSNAKFKDETIGWNRTFKHGDVVEYTCPGNWRKVANLQYSISCESDDTWTSSPPRCDVYLSKNDGTLDVKYGRNPPREWTKYFVSCFSDQISNIYSVTLPRGSKGISTLGLYFCDGIETDLFHNSTLDQYGQCSIVNRDSEWIEYLCKLLFFRDKRNTFHINLKEEIPLLKIFVHANPGNHCGLPPIPVHAQVVTEVVPGQTTQVTYKCNDPFQIDPNGPQQSTCDQRTGHWTALPKCICKDPNVPATAKISQREQFSLTLQCSDQLILDPDGPQNSTCDQLTGRWTQLPRCICPDPYVPVNAEIVEKGGFSVRFRCNEGFQLIGKESVTCDETGTWNQLPYCQLSRVTTAAIIFGLLWILTTISFLLWLIKIKLRWFQSATLPNSQIGDSSGGEQNAKLLNRKTVPGSRDLKDPHYDELDFSKAF